MRRALLWFKQDLRLDDHPAVQAALEMDRLLPVFVLDPAWFDRDPRGIRRLGVHRARFLLESLAALDGELRQRGSRLLLLAGREEETIARLTADLDLHEVLTLGEIAPQERGRMGRLRDALGHVALREYAGNGLFREDELPCPPTALPPVFSQFRSLVEERLAIFQPRPAPLALPPLPDGAEALFTPFPSLSQLGLGEPLSVPESAFPFAGGEPAALARLRHYFWDTQGVRDYQNIRDGMIGSEYSSKLSPWLANGGLSPRRVMAELRRYEAQYGGNASTACLWGELLWREFFRWMLWRHGAAMFDGSLPATRHAPDGLDERFQQWCQGRTGMPIVDACMRELAATGFLSHRGRQIVASYLVQDLRQDWRFGAAWFEEHLLDYDPASNWGNWAYIAGLGSASLVENPFNTLRLAREYDPDARYVAIWLPELQAIEPRLRHTPFLLPLLQLDLLHYPMLERIPGDWQPYLPTAA